MTVLSIFLDETGFFKWLANAVSKRAGTKQIKLFIILFVTVCFITIFSSNDIVILTLTPFICYFCKNAKIDPIPYLVSSFVAANTCSMLLIIGNPTNIYLATTYGIDFFDYLKVMALPTLFATVTAFAVMFLLFRKKLKTPLNPVYEKVEIPHRPLLIISLGLLLCATFMLSISAYIKIEMWAISVFFALLLVAVSLGFAAVKRAKPTEMIKTLKRVPWKLAPFVLAMFALVLALEKFTVTAKLGVAFGAWNAIIVYGFISIIFANLINNIPMSVLFSAILIGSNAAPAAVYATVIGSNVGAFLTPLGALAGIMWLSILKHNNIKFGFWQFVKYGIIISIPVSAAAVFGLWLIILD
jgi:arsenical pump membrane protein